MKQVVVHAHFYQPPRGNPWQNDQVPRQPSAAPFHDWNERITAECYRPFSAAHILGKDGKIAQVVNLYGRVSFNVGPTLMEWLERHARDVYEAMLDGDKRFGGAVAQAYNHTILPLMNARDKRTQIRLGLEDFSKHFGRKAQGMWLPECAVDTDTLCALADEGVQFTILSPNSAKVDTTQPYRVALPNGRSMCVFFYNGAISSAIAFERLLDDGAKLAKALSSGTGLMNIATDGESYGHHHRFGEMALAFALQHLEVTNYEKYLAAHPPQKTVEIVDPSSWSCAHGVERWRSDCGCQTHRHKNANQKWRTPLRAAIDWLGDVDHRVQTSCAWFFDDPSDIETLQVLAYAAYAIEKRPELREGFLKRLEAVKSVTGKNGAELFLDVVADQALESRIATFLAGGDEGDLAECAKRVTDRDRLRALQRHCFERHLGSPSLRTALRLS